MSSPKIGLALGTISNKLKTPADYRACLKQVGQIGYEGVEWTAIDPAIDVKEYGRILEGEGLICCANHAGEADLRERLGTVVENSRTLGCTTLAFPCLDQKYWSEEGVQSVAAFLNETGEALRQEGIQLLYHNHHFEFNRIGRKTILELIYERTDPQNLWAELDTYWIQHGGGDPVGWIQRMKGRTNHLHCKDKGMQGADSVFMEIGEGNLDWTRIVAAAKEADIEWYLVEQDSSRRDTLESAAISFDALQSALYPEGA
ncbi:MAG: sugar phosphate isomerase/epimerase [Candidatus Latescibacterota bacterium]